MESQDPENRVIAMNRRRSKYLPIYLLPPYFTNSKERHWRSWLVQTIIVSNIIMFIITMFVNNCPKNNILEINGQCVAKFLGRFSFQPLKTNPLFGPTSLTAFKLGGLEWNMVVNGHQWWRMFAAIWLHAGVIHLFVNMLSLFLIGIRLEQQFGFMRIGAIYLLSGLSGNILSLLFLQNGISVGASGALFGLIGAMLSELLTNWTVYTRKLCAMLLLLSMIIGELVFDGIHSWRVNNFGHIGGVLSGFLLGFVLLLRPQPLPRTLPVTKSKYTVFQWVSLVISLLLFIVGFTVGIVMVSRGDNGNDYCNWCHYLSSR
ncbi:RHOMBOID-like protein 2 [Impatiens glandulifera]|uniref:RHOMBOID-like protein 2 n=1 Tax=Impatiens glandulifera TaxID=253017 RepID=UPI001FB0BF74|nr:RHOMBOID-like protein 2 [Impatiens glandulifera]